MGIDFCVKFVSVLGDICWNRSYFIIITSVAVTMKLFLKSLIFLLGIIVKSGAATTESYQILKFGSTTADYVSFTPDMQPFTAVLTLYHKNLYRPNCRSTEV